MDTGAFNLTGIDVAEAEKDVDPPQDPPLSPASSTGGSTVTGPREMTRHLEPLPTFPTTAFSTSS